MPHSEHSTRECTTPTSVSTPQSIYLITGANRGLGLGFCNATVRDPANTSTSDLQALQTAEGSRLIIVKLDGFYEADPDAVVAELQSVHGIDRIDPVVANAGIESWFRPAASIPSSQLRSHFEVNALAPLSLFQATLPLLQNSPNPKFVPYILAPGLHERVRQSQETPPPRTG